MVDAINAASRVTSLRWKTPIEYAFISNRACIEQREVGADVPNFASGLRHACAKNPDVILVGEMRDLETTGSASRPRRKKTGHWSSHAAHRQRPETIERIIDITRRTSRTRSARCCPTTLQAVICQTLFRRWIQPGMVPAVE